MQGTIQVARKSKSGKNLSVQVGGEWYVSKCWEFEQTPTQAGMIGQEITFEPSTQQFPDGGSITWINEYGVTAGTTPADQAFNQAHAQGVAGAAAGPGGVPIPPPMGSPVPPGNLSQPAPMSQPVPTQNAPAPQPAVNKDAMISALALVKAVQCNTAQDAWNAFTTLYYKVLEWNPGSFDDDPRF